MISSFAIALLALYSVGIALHSVGFVLVLRIVRKGSSPYNQGQRLFLLHLIFIEMGACSMFFITRILFEVNVGRKFAVALYVFLRTSGYINYIGSMLLLTLDRVLIVRLNLRYPFYMTTRKILVAISITFLLGNLYYGIIMLVEAARPYIYLFLVVTSFMFLVCVFCSYLWIFRKVSTSGQKLQSSINESQPKSEIRPIRCKRTANLAAPLLIVITFVLFWVAPLQVSYWTNSQDWNAPHLVLHPLGFISDAVIYIFFYPAIYKELKKMLCVLNKAD